MGSHAKRRNSSISKNLRLVLLFDQRVSKSSSSLVALVVPIPTTKRQKKKEEEEGGRIERWCRPTPQLDLRSFCIFEEGWLSDEGRPSSKDTPAKSSSCGVVYSSSCSSAVSVVSAAVR